jgi:hypothetical protein
MIQFPCRCKHIFQLPDDMSGRQVQCPKCSRLVDIPTWGELSELSDDGTFKLGAPVKGDPHDFEKMQQVYRRVHLDEDGNELDLRQTLEDIAHAGTEDDVDAFDNRPTAPKYDPETGELLRPIAISPDPAHRPQHVHVAEIATGTPTLNYATQDPQQPHSLMEPLLRLMHPINLAAMFFVLLAHIFFYMSIFSLFLSVAAIFITGPAIVAHYANVIEDIGIEERDELPRFLRHFNLGDDVFYPFVHVVTAWAICFGPGRIMLLFWYLHSRLSAGVYAGVFALDVAGLIFFPAVLLTTTTSGSLLNLRPDRVLSVIAEIGPRYAFFVLLYLVAISIYVLGLIATPVQAFFLINMVRKTPFIFTGLGAYGALSTGIILMHYFAWLLGLAYREKHRRFQWVYHRDERIIPGVNAPRHSPLHNNFALGNPPVRHP